MNLTLDRVSLLRYDLLGCREHMRSPRGRRGHGGAPIDYEGGIIVSNIDQDSKGIKHVTPSGDSKTRQSIEALTTRHQGFNNIAVVYGLGTEQINGERVPVYRIIITNADKVEQQIQSNKSQEEDGKSDRDQTDDCDDDQADNDSDDDKVTTSCDQTLIKATNEAKDVIKSNNEPVV